MWPPWVSSLSVALCGSWTASTDVLGILVALRSDDSWGCSAVASLWRCPVRKSLVPFGFETGLPYIPGEDRALGPERRDFLMSLVSALSLKPFVLGL